MTFRNEQTKVNAVKEYYANLAKRNEKIVRMMTMFGKYGTPALFLAFACIYWITGVSKHFLS